MKMRYSAREHRGEYTVIATIVRLLMAIVIFAMLAMAVTSVAGAAARRLPVCDTIRAASPIKNGYSIACGNDANTVTTGTIVVSAVVNGTPNMPRNTVRPTIGASFYTYTDTGVNLVDCVGNEYEIR